MLANLPVETILLICEYPEFKDLEQLAWTNKRMMKTIKKYLPIALDRRNLFYLQYKYKNSYSYEGRICLFDSRTNSVEQIAKFTNYLASCEVATTKDKICALDNEKELFEIFDLNTRQITRGPVPPEWRIGASVAYYKNKLYYLGGEDPKTYQDTNRVDVLIDGKWQTGPAFPLPIHYVRTIACDESLYAIDGHESRKIYRLSDDEREWIEVGEVREWDWDRVVASLNGKIYITGGFNGIDALKSCLCFDPSTPVFRQISQIADMNYARYSHSLVSANRKLYAIGGFQKDSHKNFCNSIEEYNPQTNKWCEVGKINFPTRGDNILFYHLYTNNNGDKGRICLFNSYTRTAEEIAKFPNCYASYQVATTQNKIFGINNYVNTFEIYDLNTRQFSRGPDPPEWRRVASVVYFKDKLYCLGGNDPKILWKTTNRVDILIDGRWQTGPAFPFPISRVQTMTCDEILYVIDGHESRKIYRLSDDEREWIEIGEIPEQRYSFGVASLNGRIYITGGSNYPNVLKSCLCFDPSAPVGSRISKIADMNYEKHDHSLVTVNGKLYAIGGSQKDLWANFCNSIEEYDPQTNEWREVGKFTLT